MQRTEHPDVPSTDGTPNCKALQICKLQIAYNQTRTYIELELQPTVKYVIEKGAKTVTILLTLQHTTKLSIILEEI
jgi:hypothetical protein